MPESEPEASGGPQSEPEASAQPHSEPEASAESESDPQASVDPHQSEPEPSAELESKPTAPANTSYGRNSSNSWIIATEWLALMLVATAIVYGMWLLVGPVTVFTAWSRGFTGTTTLFGDTRHYLRSLCAWGMY